MIAEIRFCACGCGSTCGSNPKQKYASGACRLRDFKRRRDAKGANCVCEAGPPKCANPRCKHLVPEYHTVCSAKCWAAIDRAKRRSRLCRCGCGESLAGFPLRAKFFSGACRLRAWRLRHTATIVARGNVSTQP